MHFIGIDPGKTGGAVIIDHNWRYIGKFMNHRQLAFWLRGKGVSDRQQIRAGLEKVNADPKWGKTSIWKFAVNVGEWGGVLDAFLVSYEEVHSSKWRKLIGTARKGKEPVVEYAMKKWPEAPIVKKNEWWMADALCIAEVVRLTTLKGGVP